MADQRIVAPTDVLWRRIGAWCIDLAGPAAVGFVVALVLGTAAAMVTFLVLWWAEAVLVQGVAGASPGKAVTGLRVVDERGRPCDLRAAAVRTVAWVVDGFPYVAPLAGYATAFGDPLGRRFGDRWAGTYVVDARYVGHPPHTVLFPAEGPPRRLTTRAAYQQGFTNPVVRTGGYAGATTPTTPSTTSTTPTTSTSPDAPTPPPAGGPDGVGAVPAGDPAATDPPGPLALPVGDGAAYDRQTGGYLRWDEVHGTWAVFDEEHRCWRPVAAGERVPH